MEKRMKKKIDFLSEYNDFSLVTNLDNLKLAYRKCKKGVNWKESVQRYGGYEFQNLLEAREKLLNDKAVSKGFVEFTIRERGKIRHIKSVHISERVVQKCLCDNILTPLLSRGLIYDNGASLKGKGIHFARKRIKCHLSRFFRKTKSNKGYALVIDFSKYFDNIPHEKLFQLQKKYITDEKIFNLYKSFITPFGDGVSLGLGSQVSQISAVSYPNKLDHFCKEVLGVKYYGRYMDDSYLIHESKQYLQLCLSYIQKICNELGIKLNEKKTKIVSLHEGFWFLKGKYILLPTGKIICKANRDNTLRMRRKLKKFKKLLEQGKITKADIYTSYQSYRSNLKKFNAFYLVKNMDMLYKQLFHDTNKQGGSKNGKPSYKKCILRDKRRCSSTSYRFISNV